jgi:hypothetical protein
MAEQDVAVIGSSIADGDVIPVSVWGSRAHLEKQALATVHDLSTWIFLADKDHHMGHFIEVITGGKKNSVLLLS